MTQFDRKAGFVPPFVLTEENEIHEVAYGWLF